MEVYYPGGSNNGVETPRYLDPPGWVPPSQKSGVGGGIPAGLAGFPGLAEEIARINASGGTNQAQLTALIRRYLIQYGAVPANLNSALTGDANAAVDQLTRDLAQQATQGGVSTTAQRLRSYNQERNQGVANAAEHGLARSGATGQAIRESFGNFQRGTYGDLQSLMDQLGQGYQTFLGQQDALRQQSSQALKDALQGQIGGVGSGQIAVGGGGAAPKAPTSGWGDNNQARPRLANTPITVPSGNAWESKPLAAPKPPAAPTLGLARAQRFG